jgi:methionyl-tRNA formyltransferase
MTAAPRVLVLTSTFLRHNALAQSLANHPALDVVGIWREGKAFDPSTVGEAGTDDERVIQAHFAARDASEEAFFGAYHDLRVGSDVVVRNAAPNALNALEELDAMRALRPDVLAVFGTGLLRQPLLEAFNGRILNVHLGLSPYYRGSGTNFWPLANDEPEYVGATIHYIDAGIDTGPMVAHARPDVTSTDGPHDLGNKTIVAAIDVLAEALRLHHTLGALPAVPQEGPGRLYRRRDFNAEAVRRLYANLHSGMMQRYLDHKAERDARVKLLELPRA